MLLTNEHTASGVTANKNNDGVQALFLKYEVIQFIIILKVIKEMFPSLLGGSACSQTLEMS